jgi:hypothetical protein
MPAPRPCGRQWGASAEPAELRGPGNVTGYHTRWARPEEIADDPERIAIREALAFGKALYDIRGLAGVGGIGRYAGHGQGRLLRQPVPLAGSAPLVSDYAVEGQAPAFAPLNFVGRHLGDGRPRRPVPVTWSRYLCLWQAAEQYSASLRRSGNSSPHPEHFLRIPPASRIMSFSRS